jgi:hypothetical protein
MNMDHILFITVPMVELERISPIGVNTGTRKLPAVLAKRRANRGMEGMCMTPDGKTGRNNAINHVCPKSSCNKYYFNKNCNFRYHHRSRPIILYRQDGELLIRFVTLQHITNTDF